MSNKLAEFAVKTLKRYAEEESVTVRSTSDLSPLEEWLIIQLSKSEDTIEVLKKLSENREQ